MKKLKVKLVTTPLRYPGGKAKAIAPITAMLGEDFSEYREPFVGGGSIFIYLKQIMPNLRVWINDLNPDVYHFWKIAQSNNEELSREIAAIKAKATNGKTLYQEMVSADVSILSSFDRAIRFFVLNRITYAGIVEAGGYSPAAFTARFTDSAIARLRAVESVLDGVKITNLDYSEVIHDSGDSVAIFADPPYWKATPFKLYGKRGLLHTCFDHKLFAKNMKSCRHRWLITYDDSEEIRKNFENYVIEGWQLQYSMTSKTKRPLGSEIFIGNSNAVY